MGLYAISCKQCGKGFMWFSGSLDQRCAECKARDEAAKAVPVITSRGGIYWRIRDILFGPNRGSKADGGSEHGD